MATVEEKLRTTLDAVASQTGGRAIVHRYPDGSIDGEILLPVGRGENPRQKIDDLERALSRRRLPTDTFLATGFRFPPSEGMDRSAYDRHRGLFQVFTNFQYKASYPVAYATTIEIISRTTKRGYRKPQQILVRVHWNPEGIKPKREHK
jgi:hypothetical protein